MSPDPQAPHRPAPRRLLRAGVVFALMAVAVVAYGLVTRSVQNSHLMDLTETQAVPTVAVVTPDRIANHTGLDLPGRLEAFIRAPIYARIPGYLKSWKHDIGSRVKAGELLAEIDTPDLDQQLQQARADLNVAEANAKLAEITAKRWQALADTDAVAKQDVDQRTFTWNANMAQVNAAKANVDRLVAEEGFKRLVAPFTGIVTERQTDIGALINVGSSGGQELFEVSETSKLRVYVSVPQNYVPSVPPGTAASITVPEHPGKTYRGTVEASAQAVNAGTGTTLMEIIVDNAGGEMMPGGYAGIHLDVASAADVLSVPSSALIFNAKGLSIATVDVNERVSINPVTLQRDLGNVVEVASGLSPDDRVIQNPPDGIDNGTVVHVVQTQSAKSGAAKSTGKAERG